MNAIKRQTIANDRRLRVLLDGRYSVTPAGVVHSLTGKRGPRYTMKTRANRYGYVVVALFDGKRYLYALVHRLVALAHLPAPALAGMQVNHRDGDKSNNHVDNLEWCSSAENHRHAFETGLRRGNSGAAHPMRKLSPHAIAAIRTTYASGSVSQSALAARHGVSASQIGRIVRNERWSQHG